MGCPKNTAWTLKAELDECIELLRPHYSDATDEELHARAEWMRPKRYAAGRWPTAEEIEAKAKEEARVAAEEAAAKKAAAEEAAVLTT